MTNISASERLEAALTRIDDPSGEGARACLTVYAQAARAAANDSLEGERTCVNWLRETGK